MIFQMIRSWGSLSLLDVIFMFMSYALIILLALPVHEMAHAFTADKMGDHTARWNGRLTMNPFAHLDMIGTALIFLFGFGYAKPVPVNPRNFRNYKAGMFLTSLAGPMSNLIMGFLSLAILRIVYLFPMTLIAYGVFDILFYTFAQINIMLAVFNLLPIPPLDGYRIISNFLPPRWVYFIDQYQMFLTIAVFAFVLSGRFGNVFYSIGIPILNFFTMILGF